jgi:small subunit ribosomal protein S21
MARKEKKQTGLQVKVFNNNIEGALKKFKRMIKDSGMLVELRNRSYYEKPSTTRRKKKNLIKSRHKYKQEKENNQ